MRRDETVSDVNTYAAIVDKTKPNYPINDDAPYATADLERMLRAHDADTGALPDRLWNVVDAFDPVKLKESQRWATQFTTNQLFGTNISTTTQDITLADQPLLLAAAQQMAGISRRLVTTDSYDLPVPSQNMPSYVADGPLDGTLLILIQPQTISNRSPAIREHRRRFSTCSTTESSWSERQHETCQE